MDGGEPGFGDTGVSAETEGRSVFFGKSSGLKQELIISGNERFQPGKGLVFR